MELEVELVEELGTLAAEFDEDETAVGAPTVVDLVDESDLIDESELTVLADWDAFEFATGNTMAATVG